jgi:hypothetical protein
VASVLGRITTSDDSPRGPDVKHRIRVKNRWLERGEAIEFVLPRNLACANCDGGGCDTCEGAGALSLRERTDPAEVVQVVLPATPMGDDDKLRAVALRIPERGGAGDGRLPRGLLILTVVGAEQADEGVRRVHPSLSPPPAELIEDRESVARGSVRPEARGLSWPLVVVVAIVVWILLLALLRAAGAF